MHNLTIVLDAFLMFYFNGKVSNVFVILFQVCSGKKNEFFSRSGKFS